jgi:lysyl-tRNA synthetase, class II
MPAAVKGVILSDSLRTGLLPDWMEQRLSDKYWHWLGGLRLVEVNILKLGAEDLDRATTEISTQLRTKGYYAHFTDGNDLILVFPSKVIKVSAGDSASIEEAQRVGASYGIPLDQMPLRSLTSSDHPNSIKDEGRAPYTAEEYFRPTTGWIHFSGNEMPREGLVKLCGRVKTVSENDAAAQCKVVSGLSEVEMILHGRPSPSVGDIIGVEGIYSENAEATLDSVRWAVLTPAWDPEMWIDDAPCPWERKVVFSISRKKVLFKRASMLNRIREVLTERGFLEVETPCLIPIRDIAPLEHFRVTEKDQQAGSLRICPENALKRLVVSGLDQVFEFAKSFRPGDKPGRDRSSEFTMLECYRAYSDYEDAMSLSELVLRECAISLLGSPAIHIGGKEFDLDKPWRRVNFVDAASELIGEDVMGIQDAQYLARRLSEIDRVPASSGSLRGCYERLAELVQESFTGPTMLLGHPCETICVASRYPEVGRSRLIRRFEAFLGDLEIVHGFSELTNPFEQRTRMLALMEEKCQLGHEEHDLDEGFLNALVVGLPPTSGLGMGIERILMAMLDMELSGTVAIPQL